MSDTAQDESAIWIRTVPDDTSGYRVVVEVGQDRSIALTEDEAFKHARILLRACAMAEYDHSVFNQMRSRMDEEHALSVVHDIQQDRGPFWLGDTKPFLYLPGLLRDEKRSPVIQLRLEEGEGEGEPVGLWDLNQARMHAFMLIEAPQASELDAVYLKVLRGVIGLDENTSRAVVGELATYRPAYQLLDGQGLQRQDEA